MESKVFSNMPPAGIVYTQAPVVKTEPKQDVSVQAALPTGNKTEANTDTLHLANSNKEEKKGPIKKFKEFVANIKKFFATTGAYVKGIAKGTAQGAVAGSVIYTGGAILNAVLGKTAEKAGKVATKIPNKLLAGVVAVGALAANIFTASLNATEQQSDIDHRWTGHSK